MKTAIILFIFAFAFQQIVGTHQDEISTHQEDFAARGLKDEFSKIVKGIISLIEKTLAAILGEVEKAIDKIKNVANSGMELVEKTINGLLDAINVLEKKALDLGVDIAECVVDNKKMIQELGDKTLDKLNKNSMRVTQMINEIKEEAMETVQGYRNIVNTLLGDFSKCSIINVLCMGKVITKATITSIEITVKLPLVAANIIKSISGTILVGVADITTITKDFTVTSAALMLNVTKCVAQKIPNV